MTSRTVPVALPQSPGTAHCPCAPRACGDQNTRPLLSVDLTLSAPWLFPGAEDLRAGLGECLAASAVH